MLLSVIIPVYNLENYILNALQSLENQTLSISLFEVIIIDDGSMDNSFEIISDYMLVSKLKIKLYTQKNAGVSSARNMGMKNATGDYLYFLDGDDYIANDFLELIKDEVDKSVPDLLITSYTKVCSNEKIQFTNQSKGLTSSDVIKQKYFSGGLHINMCTLIFNREKLNRLGLLFNTKTSYGEDLEFYQKFMFCSNTVSIVTNAVFYYVYRSNSAVNKKVGLKREDALYAILRVDEYIKAIDELSSLRKIYQVKFIPAHILKVVFNLVAEEDFDNACLIANKNEYKHYVRCAKLLGLQSFKIKLLYHSPRLYVHLLAKIQIFRKFFLWAIK